MSETSISTIEQYGTHTCVVTYLSLDQKNWSIVNTIVIFGNQEYYEYHQNICVVNEEVFGLVVPQPNENENYFAIEFDSWEEVIEYNRLDFDPRINEKAIEVVILKTDDFSLSLGELISKYPDMF